MRLIDADELKKHIRRCDDSATRATFDYVDEDDIDDMPTVCDIEQIRKEILNFKEKCNASDYLGCGILEILDKYAKGERK